MLYSEQSAPTFLKCYKNHADNLLILESIYNKPNLFLIKSDEIKLVVLYHFGMVVQLPLSHAFSCSQTKRKVKTLP